MSPESAAVYAQVLAVLFVATALTPHHTTDFPRWLRWALIVPYSFAMAALWVSMAIAVGKHEVSPRAGIFLLALAIPLAVVLLVFASTPLARNYANRGSQESDSSEHNQQDPPLIPEDFLLTSMRRRGDKITVTYRR